MDRPIVTLGALLLAAGVLFVALADAVALTATGMALIGIGGVLVVAYAFLLVGRSEDEERRRRPTM